MRTNDTEYGEDYWGTLDGGAGYQDSMLWANISFVVKEMFGVDRAAGEDISSSVNVLDVGCAFGYSLRWLRRQGFDAWGVDYSQYAIDGAPDDVREFIRWYDLTSDNGLFFGPHTFKVITSFETLEHIAEEHVPTAVRNLKDAGAAEARWLFTICTDKQPGWESDPTHVTIKPREWWIDQFEAEGLSLDVRATEKVQGYWLFSQHDGVFVLRQDSE